MTLDSTAYFVANKINNLLIKLLLHCNIYASSLVKMSVVPHGVFAARKVRENEEKLKNRDHYHQVCDLTPTKYSSKYMNSIWGMYNRYSVHNFKKNMDEKVFTFNAQQETVGPKPSVEKTSTDLKASLSSAKNLLPSPGYL